jgi:GMP reductase
MKTISEDIKFDFDDILIVPAISTYINSRYADIELPEILTIFNAPMDTVVNLSNYDLFHKNKINVVLPRTVNYNHFLEHENELCDNNLFRNFRSDIFISLGFNDIEYHLKTKFITFHDNTRIIIDVANGGMCKIADYCQQIKFLRPDIKIMVGNIANPETYRYYAEKNCVDYIRVGIGNGSGCLTTKQSGVGYPKASLIREVYEEKLRFIEYNEHNKKLGYNGFGLFKVANVIPAIVADGGMRDYSDIIKAYALGADYVMIGSIFNKAFESCADNYLYGIKLNKKLAGYLYDKKFPIKKYFRGMSTKEAQKAMGKTKFKTSEGVVRYRKVEYHLDGWIENFKHYLRNAMSYADCTKLEDFIGKVNIVRITENAHKGYNK